MNKQTNQIERERKTLAIIMAVAGAIVRIFTSYKKGFVDDIVRGVGIFLLVFGVSKISEQKQWSELSAKEKKIKIAIIVALALSVIAGIVVYFLVKK